MRHLMFWHTGRNEILASWVRRHELALKQR